MKNILKVLFLGILAFFISACGDKKEVASEMTLKVGIAPNYKPFDFKENNKITGFDVDIVEAIAKREGIKIEWVEASFDGLIPALKAGKIDMIASAMSQTTERAASVDFTNVYYYTKNIYLKNKDNTIINSKEDLVGKKVGVMLGTLQEGAAKKIKGANIAANEDLSIAILALKSGKVDAAIADSTVGLSYMKENPELVSFYEEEDGSEGMSFAFDKDKHTDLIKKINAGLDLLKQNGEYNAFLEKYDLK